LRAWSAFKGLGKGPNGELSDHYNEHLGSIKGWWEFISTGCTNIDFPRKENKASSPFTWFVRPMTLRTTIAFAVFQTRANLRHRGASSSFIHSTGARPSHASCYFKERKHAEVTVTHGNSRANNTLCSTRMYRRSTRNDYWISYSIDNPVFEHITAKKDTT
jgi:hypothetical protein